LPCILQNGYTLVLKTTGAAAAVQAFVEHAFPGCKLEEEHRGYLHFMLPKTSVASLSAAFGKLQAVKQELAVENYELSQTSLEEVFCQFARLQNTDQLGAPAGSSHWWTRFWRAGATSTYALVGEQAQE
jgi:hypothetical protein